MKNFDIEPFLNFNFSDDGLEFYINVNGLRQRSMYWKPKNEPKAIVVYVHGLNSQIIVERDTIEVYNSYDIVYFACDHIGHGKSEGEPVSCTVDEIINETLEIIRIARRMYLDIPLFVVGHSLGGLSVLSLGLKHNVELLSLNVSGIISLAPYIASTPSRPISMIESVALYVLSVVCPYFRIPGRISFEHDVPEKFVEWTKKNARSKGWNTPRLIASSQYAITYVTQNAENWDPNLKLLFMMGHEDIFVDAKPALDFAYRIQEKFGQEVVQIIEYPNATHMLTKTSISTVVMKDILEFIYSDN